MCRIPRPLICYNGQSHQATWERAMPPAPVDYENTLFYGDCLRILSQVLPPASVDLIYLDPAL